MKIVRKVIASLTGAKAKALAAENQRLRVANEAKAAENQRLRVANEAKAAENQRLRVANEALRKKEKMIPRRLANARRRGNSDAVMEHLLSTLTPADTVLDCGANVGLVTEVLAATGATVHAFEPDPHALDILRRKFDAVPNVILHPVAVGNRQGTVTFWRNTPIRKNSGKAIPFTVITNRLSQPTLCRSKWR